MRISVPFSYQVTAIPYKHKLESNLRMVENTWVDVPDVDASNVTLALVVRNVEGHDAEHVYAYAGEFWVKDTRGDGDLPFRSQHLPATGQKIPEARDSSYLSRGRETSDLAAATKLLGKVGMLRTRTAGIAAYEARNWMVDGQDGPEFIEVTVESEKARNVRSSTREERLQRAKTLAQNCSIAVDGVLYHRVAEPVIVAGSGSLSRGVGWVFGCPDFLTPAGISKYRGYPVSAKDFGKVHEWFDTPDRAVEIGFSFDVVDEAHFKTKADRIALASCAQRVVIGGLSNTKTTPYIAKWCEVRDWYAAMWKGDGVQLTDGEMLSRDEGDFERLAGLMEELVAFPESREYGGIDPQGLKMWDNRAVSLELTQGRPAPLNSKPILFGA